MAKDFSRVVALAGGVGGAKLAHGLQMALPEGGLTTVVNTADDFQPVGPAYLARPRHGHVHPGGIGEPRSGLGAGGR